MKDSFLIYTQWNEQLALLSNEQRGVLFTAIMSKQCGLELPEMDGVVKMAFSFIASQLDRDNEKYIETCEKRRSAGLKGGAPAGNENAKNKQNKQKVVLEDKNKQNKQKVVETTKNNQKQAKQPEYEYEYEYDNERSLKDSCSEPTVAEPAIITIPTNKNGEEYPVTQKQLDEYVKLYPAVDVKQQFNAMRAWALSNQPKRKTYSGMPRFINAWLAKEQNKGSRPSNNAKPGFNAFSKNDYDFDKLEKELLGSG